jgi:hypothetical protein
MNKELVANLIITRLDPVSGEWEHNHAEGKIGTKEEGEKWLADLRSGKVPEGKSCKWDKVIEITDEWIEVQNFRFGPYVGPQASQLLHLIQKARLSINFE